MSNQLRATGRTTRTLQRALHRMIQGKQDVMILINTAREMDYMVGLIIKEIGIKPSVIHRAERWVEFAGRRMYFKSRNFPDQVRGFNVANIFIDHHFYEGLCWQDWEWLLSRPR